MNPSHFAIIMILAVGCAYFVFLWKSWQGFQNDRATRDAKIDELLERIPKPKAAGETASE